MSATSSPPTKDTGPEQGKGPATFTMPIQGGMLEALGINMYTTLGKCLVEFIANAFDGEASRVDITIPTDQIIAARKAVRDAARAEVKAGLRDPYEALLDPLPPTISVTISDNGHGMSWQEVEKKFLPLNRKRRMAGDGSESQLKSETGKRFVMGRKGLGKLAGFGAAAHVEVTTRRLSQPFSTTITLEDRILKTAENVTEVPIPATYQDAPASTAPGTTIRLSCLKADAVKGNLDSLKDTIAEAFSAIRPEEFSVYLNGELLEVKIPQYEFVWPEGLGPGDYSTGEVTVQDIPKFDFRYYVGFRKRGEHLPARKRGARIYCNNRLAAGPSLFGVETGMHSFHSADYLECVVEADALDRKGIDFINTNRSQLKEDNEVVRALLDSVTNIMTEAIRAHGKFRDKQAELDVEADPDAKKVRDIVDTLPRKTRAPARKLLHTLAAEFGVASIEFREMAPILIHSVNATDVLVRLIHLQTKPETIEKVAGHLRELGEIEKVDALKLYRGKRSGIIALRNLINEGLEQWGKRRLENKLHDLLKENPWLVRPEFSQYLTSDEDMLKVITNIAKELGVDRYAKILEEPGKDDETRPDLVFLMSDPSQAGPHIIYVIELKSPTFGLNIDHYRQLEDYIAKIQNWCKAHLAGTISVQGFLIGAMPNNPTSSFKQTQLLERFQSQGPNSQIRIFPLNQLLKEAQQSNADIIKVLESDLDEDGLLVGPQDALKRLPAPADAKSQ